MFSYLKILDICEENITITLYGKIEEIIKFKNEIIKKFMGSVSIIYKENNDKFYAILCKNQTCSDKLRNLDQINKYIENK